MKKLIIFFVCLMCVTDIYSNPYKLAIEYIEKTDGLSSSRTISAEDGFYIYDSLVVGLLVPLHPFYLYQCIKYQSDSVRFEELGNLYRADSAKYNFARANIYSEELKEVQQRYKRKLSNWLIYFYEPELYKDKIYVGATIMSYPGAQEHPYYPIWNDVMSSSVDFVFVYDRSMTNLLHVAHM